MTDPGLDLRSLIAEAVRDVVKDMAADMLANPPATPAGPASAGPPLTSPPPQSDHLRTVTTPRTRVERVRIADDSDLASFARHLLTLFENPKNRQDLRAGRWLFELDGHSVATDHRPALRVERGAVTERLVREAHDAGRKIVLSGPAVLTPLGRERARALGVTIEKER